MLLSCAPVVGDALTVRGGVARVRLATIVVLVGLVKGGRYVVLAWTLAKTAGTPLL